MTTRGMVVALVSVLGVPATLAQPTEAPVVRPHQWGLPPGQVGVRLLGFPSLTGPWAASPVTLRQLPLVDLRLVVRAALETKVPRAPRPRTIPLTHMMARPVDDPRAPDIELVRGPYRFETPK